MFTRKTLYVKIRLVVFAGRTVKYTGISNEDVLRGPDYLNWIVSINKAILNYKEPSKNNNYEFKKI